MKIFGVHCPAKLEDPMRKATLSLCLLMTSFIFLATSCHEVEETIANVVVLNELGAPVQGASVRLFAFGSVDEDFFGEPRFDTTAVTNAAGTVSFNFSPFYVQGQAGVAVLDIEASKSALFGTGLIKIEEELTNEATIIIE